MTYKIDIYHRDKSITFGPRFKGEIGKDIFAIKVALGLLVPAPEDGKLESGVEISYDKNIPMDKQRWFDCSTGLGIDVKKAAKFDGSLENALTTYQINNQFLITAYYFEKFGIDKIINYKIHDDTLYESEVLSQSLLASGLFESELQTIGEATIAIMHGWRPASRLVENTSYTHDEEAYTDRVDDIVPMGIYNDLENPAYPQNLEKLIEQDIVINDPVDLTDFFERSMSSTRNWLRRTGTSAGINIRHALISYLPVFSGNSPLYIATTSVVDFYLENSLFSQQLSQEQIVANAKRALYPDPFVRSTPFIIDGTRLGIYVDTEFFLPPVSGLLVNYDEPTMLMLEEKALINALRSSGIIFNLEEDDTQMEYWRRLFRLGHSGTLVKFVEYITPSLRPGQSYRALFEIDRDKFESSIRTASQPLTTTTLEGLETSESESVCLDQNSEQSERTYEEYRAHAIKKRRDLVRLIREKVQKNHGQGADVDFGALDSAFSGINVDSSTDYELIQKAGQLLPGDAFAEFISGHTEALSFFSDNIGTGNGTLDSNTDNGTNKLVITFKDLKRRIDLAVDDLNESGEIVQRERMRFEPGTQFEGSNEAINLKLIPQELTEIFSRTGQVLLDKSTLTFKFKSKNNNILGHLNGKIIDYILLNGRKTTINVFGTNEAIKRPRTVNYLSQIEDMTAVFKMSRFFDDARGACKDLGIDLDKMTAYAYVTKYTSGLKAIMDSKEGFSFRTWWEEEFIDPIKEFGQTSAENWEASLDTDNFDENAVLRALGKECTIEQVVFEVFKKLNLTSLLCDFIKCLKLPYFELTLPDFNLPPLPKIGIIGWYAGLIKFLTEQYETIITRILCTMARMIIDKLAFPFCEEQLEEFIRDDLISEQPFAKRAVIESLTRTGVSDGDKAKSFFDAVSNILTGRELCYILQGNQPDDATMVAIERLALANGVSEELQTPEDIINFFGVIGVYIPEEFCEQLSSQTTVQPTSCDETNSLLRSIRNRLQSGDTELTEEQINEAVALAEKNKQDEADRLAALFENGFNGMVPPIFGYGNPDAIMSDFPDHLKREQEKTAMSIFEDAKTSYSQGLAQYVPAMYVPIPVDLWPYDERYDQVQTLRLESAIQQLQDYSDFIKEISKVDQGFSLSTQYSKLCGLYQTEEVNTIQGTLIPPNIRDDLDLKGLRLDDGSYKVPHDATVEKPQRIPTAVPGVRAIMPGSADIMNNYGPVSYGTDIKKDTVIVHSRAIKPKLEDGLISLEAKEKEMKFLDDQIRYLNKRIRRIYSRGKKTRLRAERNVFQNRLNALDELDAQDISPQPVTYEFFMIYQMKRNRPEFAEALNYEFTLLPLKSSDPTPEDAATYVELITGYDPVVVPDMSDLYSTRMEYNNLAPVDFEISKSTCVDNLEQFQKGKGTGIITFNTWVDHFSGDRNFDDTGDDDAINAQDALREVKSRIDELRNRIVEILTNKPALVDNLLLPGLQEMLSQETERMLEEGLQPEEETVSAVANASRSEFELKFKTGDVYSPSIKLIEYPQSLDRDRYDIVVEGDFYTGLDLESDFGPAGKKEYRYCDNLEEAYRLPVPSGAHTGLDAATGYYGKRYRLKNMIVESLSKIGYYPGQSEELEDFSQDQMYVSTTESVIETLMDALHQSYLFSAFGEGSTSSDPNTDSVDSLDKRVTGKRQIKECVSNRYSFGKGSVVNFEKTILGDVSMEIAKEMTKPENAPENYDFDTPSAFDLAMQNLALIGFVRACLIDIMLKGGVAYSIWDIEPIAGERFFLDYAISHIKNELDSNSQISEIWGRIIERVTGVSNRFKALDKVVKQEILKIPNYSKQVFHPEEQQKNFYNWFLDQEVLEYNLDSFSSADSLNEPLIATEELLFDPREADNFGPRINFSEGKERFVMEHFIEIKGPRVVQRVIDEFAISAGDGLQLEAFVYNGSIIMNYEDFVYFIKLLFRTPRNVRSFQILLDTHGPNGGVISQVSRILMITPETEDEESILTKVERTISRRNLSKMSKLRRAYEVKVKTAEGKKSAMALPMIEHKRKLDFKSCYDLESYDRSDFIEAIPHMKDQIMDKSEFKLLFDNIFPIRRFMAMTSVFATSIVSGYNSMPNIMKPAKTALASAIIKTGMSRNERANMQMIERGEFIKQMTENFPTDSSSCLDFPGGLSEMFEKFFEELQRLILQLPSILFRGVANTLDPAYKEMRSHYLNCDINHLTFRGLRPAGTGDYKLTNGLYLSGRERGLDGTRQDDIAQFEGQNKGKYVPLATGFLSDLGYAASSIPNFVKFAERLGISITKLVTYIYSGNAPFLDPSFYFKIPCAPWDTGAWRDKGRYDAGQFGRYGHPLSPFTLLALSTPQLESDKRQKENQCRLIPDIDCIDTDTGEVSYSEPGSTNTSEENLVQYLDRTDPEQEYIDGDCEEWTDERIANFRGLMSVYQPLVQQVQNILISWREMEEDINYYDGRDGQLHGQSVIVGGKRNYLEGIRVGHPISFASQADLERTIGQSSPDMDPAENYHAAGLIDPLWYQAFIDLWNQYKDANSSSRRAQDQLQLILDTTCPEVHVPGEVNELIALFNQGPG
jgi:hypothetical protein